MDHEERLTLRRLSQDSNEWRQARCGRVTASAAKRAMNFNKNGKSSQDRENYKAEVIAEMLSGIATEHYVSPAMDFGIQNEKKAFGEYASATGFAVRTSGLWVHPSMDRFAASPDGTVSVNGGVEIKCPNTATHIKWLEAGDVPEEHLEQMYACMCCCEDGQKREWWDFVSFDPRLPERYRLFIKRLPRNEERIAELEAGVKTFWEEVLETIRSLDESCPEKLIRQLKESIAEPFLTNEDFAGLL